MRVTFFACDRMRVTFSPTHIYECVDATEFLTLFARMNAHSLAPDLISVAGAKNLLAARAVTETGSVVDPAMPDIEFVQTCAWLGLFTLELD